MKYLKIAVVIIFLASCKNNEVSNKTISYEDNVKSVLIKQIEAGYGAEKNETDYPNYNLTETDLDLSNQILKEYLIKNGYKVPNNIQFNEIVNKLFQRTLDYNSEKKNIYINFTNPCDRDIKFLKNNSEEVQDYSFYINKEGNFITELFSIPEVLDYEKVFPEVASLEKNMPTSKDEIKIYKWNSLENLQNIREQNLKTILSRNKYLFNDSRVDLLWLLSNDKKFLTDLVIKFGFDKEKQINKMALEELYKKYEKENPIQVERIGDLIFHKNCDGTFSIRQGLLEYVRENTNESDNRFIYALSNYVSILYDGDLNKVFENDPSKVFSELQKANIVALIASIENPAVTKFKNKKPVLWNNESTALEDLSVSHPEVIEIIIKNNYFGIQNLKEIIDNLGSDD
ncbi:hypothetical protein OA88_02680 [Flavobacterium sp. JRM]|nr:hypothetical protein OA88_02680 [Flavobacterium sp. JRM]